MFKRFLKGMLGIAVMSLTLVSCEKSPNEVVETLTVKPEEAISFNAKDNSDVILTVTTNADAWKATPTAEWIVLTPNMEKGTLSVNAKENTTTEQRIGRIRIEAGVAQPVSINVVQAAGTGDPAFFLAVCCGLSACGNCHARPGADGRRNAAAVYAAVSVGQQLF